MKRFSSGFQICIMFYIILSAHFEMALVHYHLTFQQSGKKVGTLPSHFDSESPFPNPPDHNSLHVCVFCVLISHAASLFLS